MSSKQSLALVHDADKPALGTNDIVTRFKEEPRVQDERVAELLGFNRPRVIRELIERNRAELNGYGELVTERARAGAMPHGTAKVGAPAPRFGGKPATVYYLNEGQCLVLCALARTANAARIRRDIITVFMAYRAGTLKPATVTQVPAAERMAGAIEALQAEVAALRDRPAAVDLAETHKQLAGLREAVTRQEISRQSIREVCAAVRTLREATKQNATVGDVRREMGRFGRPDGTEAIRDELRDLRGYIVAKGRPPKAEPSVLTIDPAVLSTLAALVGGRAPPAVADGSAMLYGTPAIAACLGLSPSATRHLASNGTIPTFKVGHKVCATREALAAWLAERNAAGREVRA